MLSNASSLDIWLMHFVSLPGKQFSGIYYNEIPGNKYCQPIIACIQKMFRLLWSNRHPNPCEFIWISINKYVFNFIENILHALCCTCHRMTQWMQPTWARHLILHSVTMHARDVQLVLIHVAKCIFVTQIFIHLIPHAKDLNNKIKSLWRDDVCWTVCMPHIDFFSKWMNWFWMRLSERHRNHRISRERMESCRFACLTYFLACLHIFLQICKLFNGKVHKFGVRFWCT